MTGVEPLLSHFHKKGDKSVCDNWRGISLLSVAGKVLKHILLERLVLVVDGLDLCYVK